MVNDIILIMTSYTVIIFLSFGIMSFLQAGFFMPFLKVKTSRGKKILVKIIKKTGSDFVPAIEIEGQLVFKYFKEKKRLSNYKSGLYRSYNLNCVDVDAETWGVKTTSFEGVSTNEPNKTDSLIERALLRPTTTANLEKIIILLLIVILFGLMYVGYKLSFVETLIQGLGGIAGTNL